MALFQKRTQYVRLIEEQITVKKYCLDDEHFFKLFITCNFYANTNVILSLHGWNTPIRRKTLSNQSINQSNVICIDYYLQVTMHCSRPSVINSWQWILYPRSSRAFFKIDDHEFNTQCMAISVAQGSYMYVYGFTLISVLACFYHLRSVLFTSVWFFIWSTFCLSQLFAASSSKLTESTSTCLRNTHLCKAAGVVCCGDFSAVHVDILLDSTTSILQMWPIQQRLRQLSSVYMLCRQSHWRTTMLGILSLQLTHMSRETSHVETAFNFRFRWAYM